MIYGIYMGCIWDVYGISMGYLWVIYGISYNIIPIYGESTANLHQVGGMSEVKEMGIIPGCKFFRTLNFAPAHATLWFEAFIESKYEARDSRMWTMSESG